MDRSATRRGLPAMHRAFAVRHARSRWAGDPDQFGAAAAILAGDLCLSWCDELFSSSLAEFGPSAGIDAERARAGTAVFDLMRTQLMAGQYLDVLAQSAGLGADDDGQVDLARRVIRWKSAKYTVEHPLLIGGTLAGAEPEVLEAYSAYGLALGEAFQLRDDVLGVFGDPAETGKPAGDDLREGKRTVLVALARERADEAGRQLLESALGSPDLREDDVLALREVLVRCGALAETERLIDAGVRAAEESLASAPVAEPARTALLDLVATATARRS
jgi:geranylgeranyl diphosphate synthase, type I